MTASRLRIKSVDTDMDMNAKFHIHGNPGHLSHYVKLLCWYRGSCSIWRRTTVHSTWTRFPTKRLDKVRLVIDSRRLSVKTKKIKLKLNTLNSINFRFVILRYLQSSVYSIGFQFIL